jgi:transposase
MQYYMNEMFRHFNQYRIILCMDNAAWHKAEEINMPDNMISCFLPPYSPELNPVEILWKHIRANYFNNRTFESLDEIEKQLAEALVDVHNSKTEISKLTLINNFFMKKKRIFLLMSISIVFITSGFIYKNTRAGSTQKINGVARQVI